MEERKKIVEGQMMGDQRGANVVFVLCFQFVGDVQIGDNEFGVKGLVGWVEEGWL